MAAVSTAVGFCGPKARGQPLLFFGICLCNSKAMKTSSNCPCFNKMRTCYPNLGGGDRRRSCKDIPRPRPRSPMHL
ncbi:hypothetical protein N658DRAFT_491058 [Parathielavia hyrcaniae]|uniref:Uncharacterized protein n=1 Tax=Parathielavia hyrcaniae TaxID=113614 RepID=A0AAN6T718_9PEZI|nr:hypothetical protein N658DRAFT_491058 [Parathielavia hyrcaniae]